MAHSCTSIQIQTQWNQGDSNPHCRCARPESSHWTIAPKYGEPLWSRTRTCRASTGRADHYARGSFQLIGHSCDVGSRHDVTSDERPCRLSKIHCGRSAPSAPRRSLDTHAFGCQPWIRTTLEPVQSRVPCHWASWQSVSSKGLEPSPLRVKAAFSASRDPSSLSLLPSSSPLLGFARSGSPHSCFSI